MKPERKQNPDAFYWTCGIAPHRHKVEAVAARCIERSAKGPARRWTEEMYAECKSMRAEGVTYKAIGKHFGVSGSQISHRMMIANREVIKLRFFAAHPQATWKEFWEHWRKQPPSEKYSDPMDHSAGRCS